MTMMREPSMIMLIFLSAALATPALAQTGSILGDDYQIMVPEKGSKRQASKPEQPEPWLAPKYKSPRGTVQKVRIPKSKIVRPPSATDPGMFTCHRPDGRFRICRHCPAQVRMAPRHFRIAPYVALTKLASTDRSEPIAAPTSALAFNSSLGLIQKVAR